MNKTTSNPYIAQIYAKGRDYVPTPAPKVVPAHLQDRYATWEEYQEAIYDMLNGM